MQTVPTPIQECENIVQLLQKLHNDIQMKHVAWTITPVPDGVNVQTLQMLAAELQQYNPQKHGPDPVKFQQAKALNPFDLSVAFPKRLLGFKDIKDEALQQEQMLQRTEQTLAETDKSLQNLRQYTEAKLMVELDNCRQRHVALTQQLLSVMTLLESYGLATGSVKRNYNAEQRLENQYSSLEAELSEVKLNELQYMAKCLMTNTSASSAGAQSSSNLDIDTVACLAGSQMELLEYLQEFVKQANRELRIFEQALVNAR